MATSLDRRQVVSFDDLLMSQMVHLEALTRLLAEKGVITKEEFMEMVKVVDHEMVKSETK